MVPHRLSLNSLRMKHFPHPTFGNLWVVAQDFQTPHCVDNVRSTILVLLLVGITRLIGALITTGWPHFAKLPPEFTIEFRSHGE